jgi:hypothetical protein
MNDKTKENVEMFVKQRRYSKCNIIKLIIGWVTQGKPTRTPDITREVIFLDGLRENF